MSDNYAVKDGNGNALTKAAKDLGSSVLADVVARPAEWAVTHAPAVNNQATITRAAAAAGIKHYATHVSGTIGADATGGAAVVITINLINGASAGTPLMSWTLSHPGTAGLSTPFNFGPFNVPGSAATAMTVETAATPGGHLFASVNLTGYDAL